MFKPLIMWAFTCATAPFAHSQEASVTDSISSDTTEYPFSTQSLNEIVVSASPVINKIDRKVIRPDRETLNSSSDGIDLLRKLQLAKVTVNPLTNEIAVAGGGTIVLCINGVESSSAQIAAIRPEDILRIEYHDNPGIRYSGADVIIDYITARHDSGGSLALDTFCAFASGRYATIDHISGQYNLGRSVWSMNIGYMGQRKDKWVRDYDEIWHLPDAAVSRQETGLPVTVGGSGLESIVSYNYLHPRGDMLDVRLGFDFNDVPAMEQGDRHSVLKTSLSDTEVIVTEHTEERSVRPNIGLYYLHKLTGGQTLTFDLQGSYLQSRMKHEYSENDSEESNRVNGDRYTMRFQGVYEKRSRSRAWNIGVTSNSSVIRNIYHQNPQPAKVNVTQTSTSLNGEYSDRFGNWGTMLNLRAVYNHMEQGDRTIRKILLLPGVNISFRPADRYFMRYSASLDCHMPGASETSDVSLPVQTGMIRRGNPDLNPFYTISQTFNASFENHHVTVEADVTYRHEYNPVMESVILEDGMFVRTYFNQRSFRRLSVGVTMSVRPWKDHLSLMVRPTSDHYFSHGINYHHQHNIFRIGWGADFRYGNWLAYANIISGPENRMYGEEITEEKDMNQIMIGYRHDLWSLHLGVLNAFMRDYYMETRNLSALAPYRSRAHSNRNSYYVALKFNLSLDFGRRSRHFDIPENSMDSDTGILTGTK